CRPSAFDLAAIRTTARLVQLLGKPAWVVFTAGPSHAERIHADAAELVAGFGVRVCPHRIADRAVFRHASAAGRTVFELEPDGKAAREIEHVLMWACEHMNMATPTLVEGGPQ
ncbi:MAG: ParA family protein, partial [Novosphingobium sp.]